MSRRLVAVAVLAVAVAAPAPAHAASCGFVLDYVARQLPDAAYQVYLKVCGV